MTEAYILTFFRWEKDKLPVNVSVESEIEREREREKDYVHWTNLTSYNYTYLVNLGQDFVNTVWFWLNSQHSTTHMIGKLQRK